MSECLFGFASKWSAMVIEFENTILGNERRILKKHPLFLAILQTITYFCKVNICNASLHKLKL